MARSALGEATKSVFAPRTPCTRTAGNTAAREGRAAFAGLWEPEAGKGIVLTDNYNPLEFYDAANRERLRRTIAISRRRS